MLFGDGLMVTLNSSLCNHDIFLIDCFVSKFGSISEQVGSLEEAAKAKEAGVDGIIIQGREAGGHVIGQVNKYSLLVSSFSFAAVLQEVFQETHHPSP
jgi:NAD(P)H-dependent flavin oxidoreductase YrpB (nitropropane dioxygenase family)